MNLLFCLTFIVSQVDIEINLDLDDNLDWYGVVEYNDSTISDTITPTKTSSNSFSESLVIDGKSGGRSGGHLSLVLNDIDLKNGKKYGVLFYKNGEWMSTGPLNKEDLKKLSDKTALFSKVDSSQIPDKIKENINKNDTTGEIFKKSRFLDSFLDSW
ncbi:hypothetical protein P3W45_001216 [Vairimorpha bombi]|jgi:hypothetical protein